MGKNHFQAMDNKQHKVIIFKKRKHTVSLILVLVSAGALPKRQQRQGAETEAVEGEVADSELVLLWASYGRCEPHEQRVPEKCTQIPWRRQADTAECGQSETLGGAAEKAIGVLAGLEAVWWHRAGRHWSSEQLVNAFQPLL